MPLLSHLSSRTSLCFRIDFDLSFLPVCDYLSAFLGCLGAKGTVFSLMVLAAWMGRQTYVLPRVLGKQRQGQHTLPRARDVLGEIF